MFGTERGGCLTPIAHRRRVPEYFFQFNCISYGNNVYIFKMTTITWKIKLKWPILVFGEGVLLLNPNSPWKEKANFFFFKFIKTVMEIMLIFQKSALKRETIKLKYPLEKSQSFLFPIIVQTPLPPPYHSNSYFWTGKNIWINKLKFKCIKWKQKNF